MSDILSGISVLIVFLFIFFDKFHNKILEELKKERPDKSKAIALEKYSSDLKDVLFYRAIPLLIVFLIISYTLLPKAIEVISKSKINFWDFNTLNTLFIFIEISLISFFIYSLILIVRIIIKIREK